MHLDIMSSRSTCTLLMRTQSSCYVEAPLMMEGHLHLESQSLHPNVTVYNYSIHASTYNIHFLYKTYLGDAPADTSSYIEH